MLNFQILLTFKEFATQCHLSYRRGQTVYSVKHQVFVNESAGNEQYCQKFLEAHEYSQALGSWTQGSAISEADLATAISNVGTAGYVETDGGSAQLSQVNIVGI